MQPTITLSQEQAKALALGLLPSIRAFCEEHKDENEFEIWQKQRQEKQQQSGGIKA